MIRLEEEDPMTGRIYLEVDVRCNGIRCQVPWRRSVKSKRVQTRSPETSLAFGQSDAWPLSPESFLRLLLLWWSYGLLDFLADLFCNSSSHRRTEQWLQHRETSPWTWSFSRRRCEKGTLNSISEPSEEGISVVRNSVYSTVFELESNCASQLHTQQMSCFCTDNHHLNFNGRVQTR